VRRQLVFAVLPVQISHALCFAIHTADTCASALDVSRCHHCGKLFRGPRSSISLQEHITNIHAAVAPTCKLPSGCAPSPLAPSFRLGAMFGPLESELHLLVCHQCSLTFDRKEDFDKHQLIHLPTSVQVCAIVCDSAISRINISALCPYGAIAAC